MKGQTISTDVVFAIVLFLMGVSFFFHIISQRTTNVAELERESNTLPTRLRGRGYLVENKIQGEDLKEMAQKDYKQLKEELGMKYEFAIYLEDDKGNLIDISKDAGSTCIGSPDATLNGVPCR